MTTASQTARVDRIDSLAPSLDHESRVDDDDHRALKLWLRLLTCSNLVQTRVRTRLRSDFDCTLPRFDLVAQLDRHPEGLKMGELSRRLMVTGGNITGITDQLEADGWVERAGVDNDRRAWRVKLTPAGKQAFRQMAAVHEGWIADLFSDWSERDQSQLFRLLGKLKETIRLTEAPARGSAQAPARGLTETPARDLTETPARDLTEPPARGHPGASPGEHG